jgi:hypothetical protein
MKTILAPRASVNRDVDYLIKAALLLLSSYTTIPVRFASILGIVFTIIGFIVLDYVVVEYFTVTSIPGFSFLASAITIFSGVQLFVVGIMGEYPARLFERTSGRTIYTISRTTDETG